MKCHILHIEDSKTDADLIRRMIQKSGMDFSYHLASSIEEVAHALTLFDPNILLCGDSLPAFNSKMVYDLCKEKRPGLPFILITGAISESSVVDLLKFGIDDYVLKNNLQRLPRAIENAVAKGERERKMQGLYAEFDNSETNLRVFFESASVGLILLDRNYCILELNSQAKYYSNISFGRELLKKENLLDFLPANRREELRRQFQRSFVGEKIQYESVYPQQDGSVITFEVKLTSTIHSDGTVAGICIAMQDISERKKATEEISKANQLLKLLTENISEIIALLTPDYEYIYVSPSSEKILGYTPAELIGTTPFSLMHPDDLDRMTSVNHLRGLLGKKDQISEYRMRHKNGKYVWIEANAKSLYDNDQPAAAKIQLALRDISLRKKAETIIKESEAKYRDLIEQAIDGIVILNQQGKLMQVNGSFLKMIGYEKSEITNMTISDLIPQEETENQAKELKKLVAGETRFYERVFKRKDGTTFIAEVNGQITENGLLVAFLRDITNRKNVEDEIVKTNTQLRELTAHLQNVREEERQRIAREIHDELGQQLTAIKMDAVWIDKQIPKEAAGVKNKLRGILELLDESNESVRKILKELRPRILDDHVLLEALQWQGEQFTQSTGIPIHFTTNQSSIALPQETATCIYRIYQEALTNITRHAEATQVISSLNICSDCIILTIEDDGNGFDTKMVESKKSFGLLGMKERVFSFKGKIDLISTLGKGTKIVISLPYKDLLEKD